MVAATSFGWENKELQWQTAGREELSKELLSQQIPDRAGRSAAWLSTARSDSGVSDKEMKPQSPAAPGLPNLPPIDLGVMSRTISSIN